jgi:16S rRNA A1518/A1519 N6-dimethyltransferase RsmA/KsgA/DIM1 with predicted DNA glycosylase/AP lyase activity
MNYLVRKIKAVKNEFFPSKEERLMIKKRVDLYRQFVYPNALCFDVGANMGNRVQPLLKLSARVIAVEPQKKCCKTLKRKFGNKIIIESKGLGSREEEKLLHIANHSVLSSFTEN